MMISNYVLFAISVLLLIFVFRLFRKNGIDIVKTKPDTLSEENFVSIIHSISKDLRITTNGNGSGTDSLLPTIKKAYLSIEKKLNSKAILMEYEKWLYENIFLIKSFIYGRKRRLFSNLPHINKKARILILAEAIVNHSVENISEERVALALKTVKQELSLTIEELEAFNDAIVFAALEQIYILSKQLIHYEKMRIKAAKKYLNPSLIGSDIYDFYILKNGNIADKAADIMQKNGIILQNVNYNHNIYIQERNLFAEKFFNVLIKPNSYIKPEAYLEFVPIKEILEKDKDFINMDIATRLTYLRIIGKTAKKTSLSEYVVCKKLVEIAQKSNKHIGDILYYNLYNFTKSLRTNKTFTARTREIKKRQNIYCLAVLLFGGIGLALAVYLSRNLLFLLGIIPIFLIVENILNSTLQELIPDKRLPKMNFCEIPTQCKTLIAVSEYIADKEQLKNAIRHLLSLGESQSNRNMEFSMLIDFKGGENETTSLDEEFINILKSAFKEKENFNVFIRKRVKVGKKYQAFERKRGAIMALNRYLMTGNDSEFRFILNKSLSRPRFVITLDSDSVLPVGGALELVNIIAHPCNNKYDIIATQNRYNLYSLITYYGLKYINESGMSSYPNYCSLFYKMLGYDIFCGKGIYRLDRFYNGLEGIIPSEKVLSHDILEGAILSTAQGGLCLEDIPLNYLADRERKKRWQRGDIQLLHFIFGNWKNDSGEKYKSNITIFYKYMILRNAFSVLHPFFLAIIVIIGLFLSKSLLLYGLILFAAEYIINQFIILRGLKYNRRMRYIIKRTIYNIALGFFDFFTLVYKGLSSCIVFVETIRKMIIKKGLLEWKTFYSSQKKNTIEQYVVEFCPSVILLTGICIAAYFISPVVFILAATYEIIALGAYTIAYFSGRKLNEKNTLTQDFQAYYQKIAEKTYAYFSLMRSNKGIIGDNFQLKPYKGERKMTSPTNIGFSLLAEISAYYLGLCKLETSLDRISIIVNGISCLKKWNGNLYNWYDTETLEPKNAFISSVDSGNLLGCLIICAEFVFESTGERNNTIDELINNTNLYSLFDEKNDLFYLGYDEKRNEKVGHYDMLASESRLLSLIFIALGGKVEHWRKLRREYSSYLGNTLLSWSGTMFEYLMTDIFFKPPKFSLLYQSSRNAYKLQQREKYKRIWGRSESGFYAFDENLLYQYHAFGLQRLSLRRENDSNIISPYSSMLAVAYNPKNVARNFKNLEEYGMSSEFGFFEGIDGCGRMRIIYSYMTHHQGMILSSICNVLHDGILQRLFTGNNKINGVLYLLNERSDESYFGRNILQIKPNIEINRQDYSKNINNLEQYKGACALTNGTLSVIVDSEGRIVSGYNKKYISDFRKRIYSYSDKESYYISDENSASEGFLRSSYKINKCRNVIYTDTEISIFDEENSIREDISIADGLDIIVKRFSSLDGRFLSSKHFVFYLPISLSEYDEMLSHPTYQKLFISSFFDKERGIIIFKKKEKVNIGDTFLAVILKGLNINEAETNRFNFLGRNHNVLSPTWLDKDFDKNKSLYPSFGDVLEPCAAFSADIPKDTEYFEIIYALADSEEKLFRTIGLIPQYAYSYAKDSSLLKYKLSSFANLLLWDCLYGEYSFEVFKYAKENNLFVDFFELNDRNKSILFKYDEKYRDNLKTFLQGIFDLRLLNIGLKIIIVYEESYLNSVKNYLSDLLREYFVNNYLLFEKNDVFEYVYKLVFLVVEGDLSFKRSKAKQNLVELISDKLVTPNYYQKSLPEVDAFFSGNGHFSGDYGEKYILTDGKNSFLPYSNVICAEHGGMITTENGGGYFYFQNSRENKVNDFAFDVVTDMPSEWIYLKIKDGFIRLNKGNDEYRKTTFSMGLTEYFTSFEDLSITCQTYLIKNGRARIIEIFASGDISAQSLRELIYAVEPSLDWKTEKGMFYYENTENGLEINNFRTNQRAYFRAIGNKVEFLAEDLSNQSIPYMKFAIHALPYKLFLIISNDYLFVNTLRETDIVRLKNESLKYFQSFRALSVFSNKKSFDILANRLLYQVVSSRLNGRCGYYQVGGATGFRDQLQDVLALLHYSPNRVKQQIIYSAERQYEEGDVMHWWHHPFFGMRSKISDDKLYLPYVTAKYIEATGDMAILDHKCPYLKSEILGEKEDSRVENPQCTIFEESILKHCIRAIKNTLRYGEHNLLLMGSGDWNDGLDYVCKKGLGESVILSMFCYEVITVFSEYCPVDIREELKNISESIKSNIEKYCYENGQYKRMFGDTKEWYGTPKNPIFEIDLVSQAFAVLCGLDQEDRLISSLNKAETLIDREVGIIKLLFPPQTKKHYLGYICMYPEGVRENGGQYTHAAIWYIMALAKLGRVNEAFDLFMIINPVEKCRNIQKNQQYMGEPYVLSGDVYANKDNYGRMGWSWYTGSAAWAYKLIFEMFFGILKRKNGIVILPSLPDALDGSEVYYETIGQKVKISYKKGDKNELIIDGLRHKWGSLILLNEENKKINTISIIASNLGKYD